MKTTVEKIENTRTKLTIAVQPEELRPAIDQAYKTVAEQISVPGFRKGKVPSAIIDQRVGREDILNQAVSESIDEFYRQGVAEAGIRPMGRPQADVTAWPGRCCAPSWAWPSVPAPTSSSATCPPRAARHTASSRASASRRCWCAVSSARPSCVVVSPRRGAATRPSTS